MDLRRLISYLWLQQAFFSLTYPHTKDKDLLEMIKNGNLAYELIRPQDFYLKFYIKLLSTRIVATLLRCGPIIIVGFLLPDPYKLYLPISLENFVLFIVSLFVATLLITAFVGGAIGEYFAMYKYKHKTLHKKFLYGVPLAMVFHFILISYNLFIGVMG